MEFLLLWIDDLDDAVAVVRHFAPKILGFALAVTLFVGTVLGFSLAPHATLGVLAVFASVALLETVRRRRKDHAPHGDPASL